MSRLSAAAAGLLRLTLVELARNGLPPEEPEVLRALAGLSWRLELQTRGARAAAWLAAAHDIFGANVRTAEALLREAHDLDLQRRLEDLLVGRLEPEWLGRYVEVSSIPEGASRFLLLSAPHPLLTLRALAAARPGLAVVDAPEPEAADATDRRLQARFAAARGQVPVLWERSVEAANRAAGEGRAVACVVRPARPVRDVATALENGAVAGTPVGEASGAAPVVAVLVHRSRDKRWRVELGPEEAPAAALTRLAAHVRRWPGQHLPWVVGG